MRTVRSRAGTKVTRVGSATETKLNRSEFIFRPVLCERMERNVLSPCFRHLMSFYSLSVKSMVSTFNEFFLLIVNSYPLDIVVLSETWLRDQPQSLDYVSIPGFVTEFRNR